MLHAVVTGGEGQRSELEHQLPVCCLSNVPLRPSNFTARPMYCQCMQMCVLLMNDLVSPSIKSSFYVTQTTEWQLG